MTYGIELLDEAGKTSIGVDYANIYFHEKLTGSLPGSMPYIKDLATTLTDSSERPLVYYYLPDSGAIYCAISVFYSGGVWKVRFAGEAGAGIQAYVFVEKPVLSSDWGMQIFGESGELYFDSNYKNLAVSGVAELIRGADYFWDSNSHGWGGFDIGESGWQIGQGSVSIPPKARVPKMCIAAPPAFYGLGYTVQDSIFTHYDVMLACIYRDGDFIKVGSDRAGQDYQQGDGHGNTESRHPSNYDARVRIYGFGGDESGGGVGKALVNPIWARYMVSFIDGAAYD